MASCEATRYRTFFSILLARIYAFGNKYPDAERCLDRAREEFAYIQYRAELADVDRTRAVVLLLQARVGEAKAAALAALDAYLSSGSARGVLRSNVILFLCRIAETFPWFSRLRWFRAVASRF
jgi:hypothetical protein